MRVVALDEVKGAEKWAHGLSLDEKNKHTIPDDAEPNPYEMKDEDVPKSEEQLEEEAEKKEKAETLAKGSMLDNMSEAEKKAMRAK